MSDEVGPPYNAIRKALVAGKVIPFLGAGAPLFERNPTITPWYEEKEGKDVISYLPTASELARYLALGAEVPADERGGELTKMAQFYEVSVGDVPLRNSLREIFSYQQAPTPLHEFFAGLPAPLLIVTTNYDDLMERAFQKAGKPYDVVVHLTDSASSGNVLWWPHDEPDPKEIAAQDLLIDLDQVSVVYKIHGAIDRREKCVGHYVITEDDYVEFLTRMTLGSVIPPIFAYPFQTRHFLFLGYGLYDWNLRVILNRIQAFRGHPNIKSWAIETLKKPVERKLWAVRGIDVYDGITPSQFLEELKKRFAPAEPVAPGGNQP